MIGISKLYCDQAEPSDALRYGRLSSELPSHLLQFSRDKKPVVVWNITQRCNLKCVHCYSHSQNRDYNNEMTTEQGKAMIRDLAAFGTPVLLFSGGEPLMRADLTELVQYATGHNIRAVISTNGTCITRQKARELKKTGLSYVGISLDGMKETNDTFRGVSGAFDKAMRGIQYCQEAGLKVGLRFTINRRNVQDLSAIFRLLTAYDIPRICFYHLVYAGRGSTLIEEDLSREGTRKTVDLIINQTRKLYDKGHKKEVLTVDNHTDGVYLYLRMKKENPERAENVLRLLRMNGGNSSGVGIGCVSWDGKVHADQFWRHYSFGNVKQKPFSKIWTDLSDPLMKKLKEKKKYVKGRCGACKYLDICGGNFRVRAEAVTGDIWQADPACYLTDKEIGL